MCAAIGQDSHRFEETPGKPLILGGVLFPEEPCGLLANSDGDVILHAVTNALSGVTGRNILGAAADAVCRAGGTDSRLYLAEAMKDLKAMGGCVRHLSVSIEAARPKIAPRTEEIKASLAALLDTEPAHIGLTATTGEGLTDFGRGLGISVFCLVTAEIAEGAV
ncbi:MAG: 2-C-methyl-D-erythritol 2,4-cyclodiphosphate synthase [Lachnospiraceae bacterium]|nr:2-C-methyl-D-erythritol 2,4-cyclodiphosphate synthase [Lachnospiraceae bacterium]